jgi:hypothetical protein
LKFFRPPIAGGKMQNEVFRERIERNLLDAVRSCQSGVMDTFELELGEDTDKWKFIRSRLLRAFGDRGLSARIVEILDVEFSGKVLRP